MKRQEFEQIKENAEQFSYTSLAYTEYEEVSEYEVLAQNADVLLLGGENKEARSYEIHWAANTPEALIASVKPRKEGLITFIPKEWVAAMEASGFQIRNAWHDYFADELTAACEENTAAYEFLTPAECELASEITQSCRNQSRGFTGQTKEWFLHWIGSENEDARHASVLVYRVADERSDNGISEHEMLAEEKVEAGKMVGVLCVGIYGEGADKTLWIREVAVLPEYQNQGIARKLLKQAFAYGIEYGATKAFLAADEQNAGAIHLYQSMGFVASTEEAQIDMVWQVS